jgi:hypothetical protein
MSERARARHSVDEPAVTWLDEWLRHDLNSLRDGGVAMSQHYVALSRKCCGDRVAQPVVTR